MPMYRTCPYCGSNLDPGETCDCKKEPEAVTPKRIVTREDWERARDFIKAANPGDLVVEEIVDEMRDSVPPASMKAGYLQAGEPYSHELDSESGRWRATYMTFRMVGRDWQYCGCCFLGGTEQPQALTDRLNRESGERRL